ncbi:MAG: glutathione S-transferase N-terminal domain-containing protein, partial [Clostridia bacterium]|nr:glutathione S-transferase N-terminal domain-containing protein [Clostridia bacterium]
IAENYKLPYYTLSPTYSVCREHGYLAGEHFTCPRCGEKAEVYSRITGYYRPVQNWNDGKAQEYVDRKVYDVASSHLTHKGPVLVDAGCCTPVVELPAEDASARIILFATKTCPNCKVAAAMLDKAGIAYEKLIVDENRELAESLGLRQAPTLVIQQGDNVTKLAGVAAIREYLNGKN